MKIKPKQASPSPLVSDYVRGRSKTQEDYKVRSYLEDTIRSLGDKFKHMYIVERTGGFDDELHPSGPVLLEWNDQYSAIGIDPKSVDEILRRLPHLKPANQAIKQLKQAGYGGYPKRGQFDKNCYALILPKGKNHLSSQKTYLVVAKIEQDTYEDELSYLNLVADRLTKRFIELGVPDAHASLEISKPDELSEALSIKLVPESIIPRPPAEILSAEEAADMFNREATFKILLSYEEPEAYMQPTKKQVMNAISNMSELSLASQCPDSLRLQHIGYAGWQELGEYPDDVYVLDITQMLNHIVDDNYQKFILFHVYNSSHATVANPDELEIQTALNKLVANAGFSDVGIEIISEGGSEGPDYFSVTHSGYCPPEERVRQALASIPGVSPDPTIPQPIGAPGYLSPNGKFTIEKSGVLDPSKASELGALGYMNFDRTFSPLGTEQKGLVNSVEVDLNEVPELADLIKRTNINKVHIYLAKNVVDGY